MTTGTCFALLHREKIEIINSTVNLWQRHSSESGNIYPRGIQIRSRGGGGGGKCARDELVCLARLSLPRAKQEKTSVTGAV